MKGKAQKNRGYELLDAESYWINNIIINGNGKKVGNWINIDPNLIELMILSME